MKRFWLVLLSLGLVMAFSASAFAVDVKFSGSYFAAGAYVDKVTPYKESGSNTQQSSAFYFQKLQLTTEFVAAPGLSLVTRANIMERTWGATRSSASTTLDNQSAATRAENENIGFDYAYVNYMSPIGQWKVGFQSDSVFGTTFGDSDTPRGKISYSLPIGNFKLGAAIVKYNDNSLTAINSTTLTDNDKDKYTLYGAYTAKVWEAGLLGNYFNDATGRSTSTALNTSYKGKYYSVTPYAKAKIGPVAVQAELTYYFGKYKQYDRDGSTDQDVSSLAGFVDALATFGPVYVGGTFAYAQGDDGSDTSKIKNVATGGKDWKPCLILWNSDYYYWVDASSTLNKGAEMSNAYLYQLRGGVKPIDKLDIGMAVAFAQADKNTVTNAVSKDYGWEIDVTGSYKITNNLSYMLGVGYLIPGDAYKGAASTTQLNNTYLVINKLTLTF
jgi:hypothetical protein